MKLLKKLSCFCDRIMYEIRFINLKKGLICAGISVLFGLLFWIIGGRVDRVTFYFLFPRCAAPIVVMFVFWFIAYAVIGFIISQIICGCEKYKRNNAYKCIMFICLMQLFVLVSYPIFFRALAPFITFLAFLIAEAFCLLAILSCFKNYCIWTIFLTIYFFWLCYNGYTALAVAIIN